MAKIADKYDIMLKKEVVYLALILTLNPSLDKWYWIKDFHKGKSHKVNDFKYAVGGGGINVAKVINEFNEQVMVTGFAGGDTGRYIERELDKMGIYHRFVPIKEESKSTIRIISKYDVSTEIMEEGPYIHSEYVSKLYELFHELISKWDLICACGDIPKGLPIDILFNLIILAKKYNKKFFLSSKGEYLKSAIKAIPYFVCLTKEELEDYLGCSVESNLEIIQAGKYLSQDGIKIVMIFLGEEGVYVFFQGYIYMIRVPKIKIVNYESARDSMLGGYMASIMRDYDFEFTLRVSVACGLANAMELEPGKVDMATMKRIMNELVIIKSQF